MPQVSQNNLKKGVIYLSTDELEEGPGCLHSLKEFLPDLAKLCVVSTRTWARSPSPESGWVEGLTP